MPIEDTLEFKVADACYTETIISPPRPWLEFVYHDKPRLACVIKPSPSAGGLLCRTSDGWRSFKPSKMIGIKDVSTLGD